MERICVKYRRRACTLLLSLGEILVKAPSKPPKAESTGNYDTNLLPADYQVPVRGPTRLRLLIQHLGLVQWGYGPVRRLVIEEVWVIIRELLTDHSSINALTASLRAFNASRW